MRAAVYFMFEDRQYLIKLQTEFASHWTEKTKAEIRAIQTVLAQAIASNSESDWDTIRPEPFTEPVPEALAKSDLPPEPKPPLNSLLSYLTGSRRQYLTERYERDRTAWVELKLQTEAEQKQYLGTLHAWQERRREHADAIEAFNRSIDALRAIIEQDDIKAANRDATEILTGTLSVLSHRGITFTADAIEQLSVERAVATVTGLLLSQRLKLVFPLSALREYDIDFSLKVIADNRVIVIDFSLPRPSNLPSGRGIIYIKSRDTFDKLPLSSSAIQELYDNLLYQICLIMPYWIFQFRPLQSIASVVFNGWATFTNPTTGHDRRACIMSLHAEREAFAKINPARVEPKACFRALKGVSGAQLHDMVPVAPLVRGSQEDPRFVESMEVADRVREGTNLAAIGWEDFEHLIRESSRRSSRPRAARSA
jgi:restriction system protein